MFTVLKNIAT